MAVNVFTGSHGFCEVNGFRFPVSNFAVETRIEPSTLPDGSFVGGPMSAHFRVEGTAYSDFHFNALECSASGIRALDWLESMTDEERAFVRHMAAHPHDARNCLLIFADWLEERGRMEETQSLRARP